MNRTAQILRVFQVVLVLGILVAIGAVINQVISADPSTPKTELERALFASEEAVRANPKDSTSRIKLAAAYLERGNYIGSLEQADIAVRLDPKDPTGYYIKGMALHKLDRLEEAEEALTKSVEMEGQLAPFYQDAWLALSRVQEDANKDKLALTSMTRAINFGPENAVLLYERGAFYERQKKWELALEDYAAALEYVPNYEPAQEAFQKLKKAQPKIFEKLQKAYGFDTTATPAPEQKD